MTLREHHAEIEALPSLRAFARVNVRAMLTLGSEIAWLVRLLVDARASGRDAFRAINTKVSWGSARTQYSIRRGSDALGR